MITYKVRDSDAGDALGSVEIADEAADEEVLVALLNAGYLTPPIDYYSITDGDALSEAGDRCIRDEYGEPVLVLETNGDEEDDEDEEEPDDDDDDEPEDDEPEDADT